MTTDLRSALRIAHRVRQQLLEAHARRIVDASQQLERWRVRADHLRHPNRHALLARDNQWAAGARRSANAARRQLRELGCDLPAIQRMYEQIAEVQVPALRDLLGELDQIEDEFGGWRLQPRPIRLCVCTSPIVLDGIDLGSFDIQLHLDDLSGLCIRQPYDIVALDPNPAQSNDSVTHPHVSDEGLCEGDAIHPIRLALSGGRLMAIVAVGGETYARLRFNTGPRADLHIGVEVEFGGGFGGSDLETWEHEYAACVEAIDDHNFAAANGGWDEQLQRSDRMLDPYLLSCEALEFIGEMAPANLGDINDDDGWEAWMAAQDEIEVA